jgi:hypothetical protein
MKKQKSNLSSSIEDPSFIAKRERDNPFTVLEQNTATKKQRTEEVTQANNSRNISTNFSTEPSQPSKIYIYK